MGKGDMETILSRVGSMVLENVDTMVCGCAGIDGCFGGDHRHLLWSATVKSCIAHALEDVTAQMVKRLVALPVFVRTYFG